MKRVVVSALVVLVCSCTTTRQTTVKNTSPKPNKDDFGPQCRDKVAGKAGTRTYKVRRICDVASGYAEGKYSWLDKEKITAENFPVPADCKNEDVEVRLFGFYDIGLIALPVGELEDGLRKLGYQHADWTVLLPFWEKYPEFQRNYHVIGTGLHQYYPSSNHSCPYQTSQNCSDPKPVLVHYALISWECPCRFAAYRK